VLELASASSLRNLKLEPTLNLLLVALAVVLAAVFVQSFRVLVAPILNFFHDAILIPISLWLIVNNGFFSPALFRISIVSKGQIAMAKGQFEASVTLQLVVTKYFTPLTVSRNNRVQVPAIAFERRCVALTIEFLFLHNTLLIPSKTWRIPTFARTHIIFPIDITEVTTCNKSLQLVLAKVLYISRIAPA